MLAVALVKLLITSIAMVGLVRLAVIVFIGDTQNDLTVWRLIHIVRRAWSRNVEEISRS